ncbi:Uncharacterised protein [Mycobacterium tuberculosis]|nr:Uncharacterised protein [Mycobacterium tuberculosis]
MGMSIQKLVYHLLKKQSIYQMDKLLKGLSLFLNLILVSLSQKSCI